MSQIYRKTRQLDKAIAACNEALRFEPDNAELLRQLGMCHQLGRNLTQAIAVYTRCIASAQLRGPEWVCGDAHQLRGEVYMLRGEDDKALQDFELALGLLPVSRYVNQAFAWFLLACSHPEYRDPPRALKMAGRAVELAPNDPVVWRTLGAAQYRTGDVAAALASLDKASKLGADSLFVRFFLAMVHYELGKTNQARKYFELGEQRLTEGYFGWGAILECRLRDEAAKLLGIDVPLSDKPRVEDRNDQTKTQKSP